MLMNFLGNETEFSAFAFSLKDEQQKMKSEKNETKVLMLTAIGNKNNRFMIHFLSLILLLE